MDAQEIIKLKAGTYIFHEEAAPNGYLKVTDITFEVDEQGKVTVKNANGNEVKANENKLIDLMEALTENRIEDYEETLQDILLKSVSYNDTKKGNEAFYHGFILGMSLYLEGEYIVKSNIESGLGRYDVSIEPKNKNKKGYILEFKATDNVDKLEEISSQ